MGSRGTPSKVKGVKQAPRAQYALLDILDGAQPLDGTAFDIV